MYARDARACISSFRITIIMFPSPFLHSDVSRNAITGPLPQSLANLSALQQFNAANNLFKGALPDSWAVMRNLRSVVLSSNLLTGTLPSGWGDMLLQYVVLDNNDLMGWLPQTWGSMSFLRVLSLGRGGDYIVVAAVMCILVYKQPESPRASPSESPHHISTHSK